MSAKVEKQNAGESESVARKLEAELRRVKAELRETVGKYENSIEKLEAVNGDLRESEERFRRYFELGLIGMAITSPTKGVMEVNDEICRILGYERGELLQMSWAEMTHPDDLAADVAEFNRVMAGEIDGYTLDKRWIRKDGQIVNTTISVKALRSAESFVSTRKRARHRSRRHLN